MPYLNTSRVPLDLEPDGRVIAPGGTVRTLDLSSAHNSRLVREGFLEERPGESEEQPREAAATEEPAAEPAPAEQEPEAPAPAPVKRRQTRRRTAPSPDQES